MRNFTNEIIYKVFKKANLISLVLLLLSIFVVCSKMFFPFHRIISIILFVLGVIFCIVSTINFKKLKKQLFKNINRIKSRQSILVFLILLSFSTLFLSNNLRKNLSLFDLNKAEENAISSLKGYSNQQLNIINEIKVNYIEKLNSFEDYSYKDIDNLQGYLKSYINLQNKITKITNTFAPYYSIPFYEFPSQHQNSFLISKLSFKISSTNFKKLNQALEKTPYLIKMLNLPNEKLSLSRDSFTLLTQNIFSLNNLIYLILSDVNESILNLFLKDNSNTIYLRNTLKEYSGDIFNASHIFATLTLDKYENKVSRTVLPIQKSILLTTSYIKYYPENYKIDNSSLKKSYSLLEPGDVLLQRREWQLTNVGIPGFWTHSAIMLKEKNDLITYFSEIIDEEALLKKFKAVNSLFFEDYFNSSKPLAVIESNRDGVILQSHKDSNQADYLSAFSPKKEKEDRLNMILEAVKHYKKPYDYNFDYIDNKSIACSELVYRSLKAIDVNLPLVQTVGRVIVSPQQIAESDILNFKLFINTQSDKNTFESYQSLKDATFNF